MSGEIKVDMIVSGNGKDTDFNTLNGIPSYGEKGNVVQRFLNVFHRQGKWSSSRMPVTADQESINDRFVESDRTTLRGHDDWDEKREHGTVRSGPLISGAAYCFSSCSMILLNKIVLSSYGFNAGISLMFYQNLISSIIVIFLGSCGLVSLEKLNWKLIKVWIPVNLIFIGMLVSGMYSLKYINVAMVTILKNMTNILTAIGEYYMFRKRQNQKVWTAMFVMIISAISGGITDLSYNSLGYAWQAVNCILTASYSLTLRRVMDKAKQFTKSGSLNEISMVLLNNLLSLPFAICLIIIFDEWNYVINAEVIRLPIFWVVATASGVLGLSISFTSMWFLGQTGPTTYSLVGSLNKIPISLAGLLLFKVPLSLPNFSSILFGLLAGILFARAKMS
ncbi:hypothetical protein Leryth_000356 [Lithospermum erythrorhizon]|nr:hypothetical protein Leryth_000356 [Lithospermum erythrorhizon]